MKQKIQNSGYLYVTLCINNKAKNMLVHRLVALTFIPNPEKYEFVNHKDGNKKNNHVDNLEWCTNAYNIRHAYKNGLRKITKKHLDRLINWNKTDHAVKISQFSKSGELIDSFTSMVDAANKTGLNYSAIVDCVRGRHKHCGGFNFKVTKMLPLIKEKSKLPDILKQEVNY